MNEGSEALEATPAQLSLEETVEAYMPFVRHIVNRTVGSGTRGTYLQYEDLIAYGLQGLVEAYKSFRRDRGVRFSTFAMPRIRGAILDALRAAHHLPRSLQRASAELDKVTSALHVSLGRQPTVPEIAECIGETPEKVRDTVRTTGLKVLSLEGLSEYGWDGKAEKLKGLSDDDVNLDPEAVTMEKVLIDQVRDAIGALPGRERTIIELYYLKSCSLQSIADVMQISPSRVSQLRHRAVRRLRQRLVERQLAEAA
ncbi:MAG TPA: sigma-70 family RNA polymerase sigma factor [Dehalococcoidia bacterium]|nr:sigma-70 family RNA polymerase sigma factor [Dehalococcoidia bacterium]